MKFDLPARLHWSRETGLVAWLLTMGTMDAND